MRICLRLHVIALLFCGVVSLHATATDVVKTTRGKACESDKSAVTRVSWTLPVVRLPADGATKAINAAIRGHVLKELEWDALRSTPPCKEPDSDSEAIRLTVDMDCRVTFLSDRLVSISCHRGANADGRASAEVTALIFRVSASGKAERLEACGLYRDDSACTTVLGRIQASIREDNDSQDDTDPKLRDDEIAGAASKMLASGVLSHEGARFEAFGDHHTYFELTIPLAEIEPLLAPDIRKDLHSPVK